MPTYKFKNNQTGEEWEEFFTSSSAKDEVMKEYPHVQQVPTSFGIVSTTGTFDGKTDAGWKEVLSKAAEAHPDSPLAERYGRKSIKDVKTKAVVDKHRNKWRSN